MKQPSGGAAGDATRPSVGIVVEWEEPRATTLMEELVIDVGGEVRRFREDIVSKWAAEYARRRAADEVAEDQSVAAADLHSWSRAYFQARALEQGRPGETPVADDDSSGDDAGRVRAA